MKKLNKEEVEEKIAASFSLLEVIIIVLVTAISVSLCSGVVVYNNMDIKNKEDKYISEIDSTYNKILEDYVDNVDKNKLVDGAINGMFSVLEDPYSTYLDKNETKELNTKLEGKYEGIGIEIKDTNNGIEIINVFKDSPADKKGIKKGDIVLEVNDLNLKGKSTSYLSYTVKYSSKEQIKLTIKRGDETKKFSINKDSIEAPMSKYKKIDNVGYIIISNFSKNSYKEMKKIIKKAKNDKVKSLVIDLRGNPGGYLSSAYQISDLFIEKGKVIYQIQEKKSIKKYKASTKDKENFKIAILINGNSASASEVMALALKESYGAELVGEKSYGKGSIQHTKKLDTGSMVKYTTAKWLSPKGKSVDKIGIKPDIYIKYDTKLINGLDNQLNKAIEIVK